MPDLRAVAGRRSLARASHLVLLWPAADPRAPREIQPPPPTSGPPPLVELRDYNSRQALGSHCSNFIGLTLQELLGVEVPNASPGCRGWEFFCRWGG